MTSGIGNPDWQRRYGFSPVQLANYSFTDGVSYLTNTIDTNAFPNLLFTIFGPGTAAFNVLQIDWYNDANKTTLLITTTIVPTPSSECTIRVPVITRYFTITWQYVSGVGAGTWQVWVFGTTSNNDNQATQDTSTASIIINATVAAGATVTTMAASTYQGPAMIAVSHGTNNSWDSWLEYYDTNLKAWTQFWIVKGADKNSLAWTERIYLPYAPVRLNARNRDTVAQAMFATLTNGVS